MSHPTTPTGPLPLHGPSIRPAASVVIPALDAADTLPDQLASLAAQVGAPPFEVVVADNGSSDGTRAAAEALDLPYSLRVVDASDAPGAAHARNVGAVEAGADILLFCDADDQVSATWVRDLHQACTSSGLQVVAGNLVLADNPAHVLAGYGTDPSDGSDELLVDAGPFAGYLPSVCSASFAIPRADYLAVGGMDSSYRTGCEETDLSWRVQEAGLQVYFSPRARVRYRLRTTPRAVLRQQRGYQLGRVLLFVRYASHGMVGPSTKASLLALARAALTVPVWVWTPRGRLGAAYRIGGHLGALEGIWRYRVRGDVPPPRTMPGHAGLTAAARTTTLGSSSPRSRRG